MVNSSKGDCETIANALIAFILDCKSVFEIKEELEVAIPDSG